MKTRNRMFCLLLVGILAVGLSLSGCGPAEDDVITIRHLTYHDEGNKLLTGYWMFIERLEEEMGDRIELEYRGGPEAVPAFDQFEAVTEGVADMAIIPPSFYNGIVPEVWAVDAVPHDPVEVRERGIIDLLDGVHRPHNAVYLGHATGYIPFYMYLTDPVDPEDPDFSQFTLRISPVYESFFEAVGASTTTMAPADVYTAMERGTVDGLGWPALGGVDLGFHEVSNYKIEPAFYQVLDAVVFNAETWENLPDDVRQDIENILIEVEQDMADEFQRLMEEEADQFEAAGVETIELAPDVADWYIEHSIEAKWEKATELAPDFAPEFRELVDQ